MMAIDADRANLCPKLVKDCMSSPNDEELCVIPKRENASRSTSFTSQVAFLAIEFLREASIFMIESNELHDAKYDPIACLSQLTQLMQHHYWNMAHKFRTISQTHLPQMIPFTPHELEGAFVGFLALEIDYCASQDEASANVASQARDAGASL